MKTKNAPRTVVAVVTVVLPGPTRKREPAAYHYHVTYRNPELAEPGCLMTWNVCGGREEYQIAAERTEMGELRWHCTCPDAVYRGAESHAYCCKHIQGLQALLHTSGTPVATELTAA